MEQVKDNSHIKRISKIVLTVLYYVFIVVLLTFSIVTIASRGEGNIPNLFGRGYLAVLTDSMTTDGEDSIDVGDLLYVRILNDEMRSELEVGDVVTFYDSRNKIFNTHEIVEVTKNENGETVSVVTQGRKEGAPKDEAMSVLMVKAKLTDVKKGGGRFIIFLQSTAGFGLLIVLPVFILFVIQGIRFYLIIKGDKKPVEAIDLEAEREKIRAQILQEMAEEENKKDDN
jgi:signal peptidase